MTAYILLIDDDQTMADRLQPVLTHQGYRVDRATPDADARHLADTRPDLVILGVDPARKGWRFCHQLLPALQGRLLLLLANDDELDRVKGLRLGADDCMTKPVTLSELTARVRALLRRSVPARPRSLFVDGNLVVDLAQRQVRIDDQTVALTPTEFRLLACLVQHAGEVLSHGRLVREVWDADGNHVPGHLAPHIRGLRQKLEADPRHPRRIVTRRGQGYMFAPFAPGRGHNSEFRN